MELATSLWLVAPEILLGASALLLVLVTAWGGDKASRFISLAACVVLGAAFFLVAPAVCAGAAGADTVAFYGQIRADAFAGMAKLMIYAAAGAAVVVAPAYFDRLDAMRGEYPVLVLLAVLGMSIMVSSGDLLTLYLGLELNSLAAYVLAAFLRNDDRSAEAGLKYFVLGALASGILLFGMSLLYGFTGTTSFDGIAAALEGGVGTGAMFGAILVLAGLAFKISAVPFHMWTPDVYEGAPTPVTLFFASAPKVAAVALTARVALEALGSQVDIWRQIVIFAAIASIVIGALGAMGQSNIKRLLAYSSINNVGFMLIGLAAGTAMGISSMLFYLLIYVLTTLGSFICVLEMRDAEGKQLESLSSLAGLSQTRPGLAAGMAVFMFSLAGIPPLFGFWGKFLVFEAAVAAGMLPLAVIGIAASVIGAYYYIKVVKIMYFDDPADQIVRTGHKSENALIALLALSVSPLGYLAIPFLAPVTATAAQALF